MTRRHDNVVIIGSSLPFTKRRTARRWFDECAIAIFWGKVVGGWVEGFTDPICSGCISQDFAVKEDSQAVVRGFEFWRTRVRRNVLLGRASSHAGDRAPADQGSKH